MIFCLNFSLPLESDDMRDSLLQTAYLMLRSGGKRKVFRTKEYEGIVTTKYHRILLGCIAGIQFDATIESDSGKNTVRFLVRDQDLRLVEEAEVGAWLTREELLTGEIPADKIRPNPIRKVAHGYN